MRQPKHTKDFNVFWEVRKKLRGALRILVVQRKLQPNCQQKRMQTGGGPGLRDTRHSRQQKKDRIENNGSKGCKEQLNHETSYTLMSEHSWPGV